MTTKTTAELRPGDVVSIYGHRRTVASVTTSPHVPDLLRVNYVPIETAAGIGGWAEPEDEWQVDAPSKLDLAIQRAQELADAYEQHPGMPGGIALRDIRELLALFRAAR